MVVGDTTVGSTPGCDEKARLRCHYFRWHARDRRWENDGQILLQDLNKLRSKAEEPLYLKDVLPANANATKVLLTGGGGTMRAAMAAGIGMKNSGTRNGIAPKGGAIRISAESTGLRQSRATTKLIAELMGGAAKSAGHGHSR